jgi:hypothetical protein
MELFGFYMLGFLSGCIFLIGLSYLSIRRDTASLDKLTKEVLDEAEDLKKKYQTVKPRLKKAAEISNQQLDLLAQTQAPSMNALHSKFKNELVGQIKSLENEKRDLLRSILKEGFDPNLTIGTPDGGKEVLRLSEYMTRNGIPLDQPADAAPMPPQAKPTKAGKFFVINGGKDDPTTH